MATVIKYVGDGSFINGLPARDLDEHDWQIIGLQGRQQEVLDSDLYEAVGDVEVVDTSDIGTTLPLITPEINEALADAGYTSIEAVQAASDETLLAVPGIGKGRLKTIREATS